MKPTLSALLIMLLAAVPAWAEPLRAGAARTVITPPIGHPMWGYAVRGNEPSVGVRDPLHARAMVLSVGTKAIAAVSLDLGRAPTRQSMHNIRLEAKKKTGVETLFISATHTHHGPVLELDNWPSKDKPYTRELEEKIVSLIAEAHRGLAPARLGIASHEVAWNRNRHSKRADRPVDKELIIVRIDDSMGKPIAHLVNYSAHPTMLPAKLREFSADYPGVFAKHVEKELGGVCLFLQGAAGDLSPNPPGEATPEKFGTALGELVVAKSRALTCDRANLKGCKTHERDFKFASRVNISNPFIHAAYSIAFFPALVDFYEREYRDGVRPHLTSVVLDGRIGIVGVSGEFFCGHALHLKKRARLEHLLFLGYCNDYQQYFPTIEAAAEGGYGADSIVSPVEVSAGERITDQALMDLLALRNLLPLSK